MAPLIVPYIGVLLVLRSRRPAIGLLLAICAGSLGLLGGLLSFLAMSPGLATGEPVALYSLVFILTQALLVVSAAKAYSASAPAAPAAPQARRRELAAQVSFWMGIVAVPAAAAGLALVASAPSFSDGRLDDTGGALILTGVLLGAPAVALGHAARRRIRQRRDKREGACAANFGCALGYGALAMIVAPWIALVMAPHHAPSYEASATSTLRTLNTAMVTYETTFNQGYPASLQQLGPPSSGQPDANNADLVDLVLAGRVKGGSANRTVKNGYRFFYNPGPLDPKGRITSYTINGYPIELGVTGQRFFFTDESNVIPGNATRPATVTDQPI